MSIFIAVVVIGLIAREHERRHRIRNRHRWWHNWRSR